MSRAPIHMKSRLGIQMGASKVQVYMPKHNQEDTILIQTVDQLLASLLKSEPFGLKWNDTLSYDIHKNKTLIRFY